MNLVRTGFMCDFHYDIVSLVMLSSDSVLDCQLVGQEFKSSLEQKFVSGFLFHLCPHANSAIMSTPTVLCQWEDPLVRKKTGHLPSYAEAKKMKLLTLDTHSCLSVSLGLV